MVAGGRSDGRISFARCGALWASIYGSFAIGAPAIAAPAVQPNIVGQVFLVSGHDYSKVRVIRQHREFGAHQWEPVYPDDQVLVRQADVSARVELTAGEVSPLIDAHSPAFHAPAAGRDHFTLKTIGEVLACFPNVFHPPSSKQRADTTPAPWRGDPAPTFSAILPNVEQVMSASAAGITIPVVWSGARARAQLVDEGGSMVAQASPREAGYAELYSPSLDPGRYRLNISTGHGHLDIAVHVDGAPSQASDGAVATAEAAKALKGAPGRRLQALVDLRRLADTNYVAYALLRSIRAGTAD